MAWNDWDSTSKSARLVHHLLKAFTMGVIPNTSEERMKPSGQQGLRREASIIAVTIAYWVALPIGRRAIHVVLLDDTPRLSP